jgi:hypothetical protein
MLFMLGRKYPNAKAPNAKQIRITQSSFEFYDNSGENQLQFKGLLSQ